MDDHDDPAPSDQLTLPSRPADDVLERDLTLPRQPLFSVRRLVMALLLAAAVAMLVLGFGGSDEPGATGRDGAIVALFPGRGDRVLSQSQVGAELRQGYDGRLTVNGVPIPEEQMEGALTPEALRQLPPSEQGQGIRPNNKNTVKFKPGPGRALARLDTGAVDLSLRYWRAEDGPDNAQTFNWTIYVT